MRLSGTPAEAVHVHFTTDSEAALPDGTSDSIRPICRADIA